MAFVKRTAADVFKAIHLVEDGASQSYAGVVFVRRVLAFGADVNRDRHTGVCQGEGIDVGLDSP